MPIASVYVTHAWPVFWECVSLWFLAGELVMVGDHSITLSALFAVLIKRFREI